MYSRSMRHFHFLPASEQPPQSIGRHNSLSNNPWEHLPYCIGITTFHDGLVPLSEASGTVLVATGIIKDSKPERNWWWYGIYSNIDSMYWHFCININTYEVMDFFVLFFFQGTLKMMDVSINDDSIYCTWPVVWIFIGNSQY